jgi:hypothetical protein
MKNSQQTIAWMMCALGLLLSGEAWAAQAGRVQFVNGEVQLTTVAGQVHVLQKGDPVNEGDTVVSAQNASAQIKMLDGGFIAIRPDTRLKFDSFKFSGKQGEPENSFFSLFKGGFRAITGLIGRIRHEDYKITTPVATIGIRGTDHETVMLLPDNPLVLAGQAAPGAYNKVNVGETSITTDAGTVNVLPNQMGFAGGPNQMPQIQPVNTNLFTVTPPPAPGAKMGNGGGGESTSRSTAVVDNTAQAASGGSGTTTTTTTTTTTAPPTVVSTPTQTLSSSATLAFPTTAAGGIGLFYSDASGNWSAGGGGTAQTTSTASGGLASFVTNNNYTTNCASGTTCNNNVSFTGGSLGSASILDLGANAAAGNLHWGRWSGAGSTVSGLPSGATFQNVLVYIGGDIPVMPTGGTATYVPVGGTLPVDRNGTTGQFLGATVAVSFANLNIAVSNMQVAFGGGTYTMAGSGSFQSSGIISSVAMTGTCSGTCATSTPTGDYAGAFTGANAAGIAMAYHITNSTQTGTAPTFEIMGVQGFAKQ